MLIRVARREDWSEWLRMRRTLWPDDAIEADEAEMRDYLERTDKYLVVVAEHEQARLVGFLEASVRDYAEDCDSRNVGYIEEWYVDAEFRLKGIGAKLVRAAEEWARGKGLVEMASDCELENETSLAAHLRLGYAETSRLIHFRKKL